MAGILLGAILLLALLGFDTIVLGACGVRGFKSALYGSCAPCLAIPLAAIPIHAIFSNQMSMRGYSPIFFILIFIFLAWHVVTLGILISHHFSSTELPAKRIYLILGVLFAAEITTSLIFLTQVPPLFDVTYLQFLEEFF
nr:hypothetical protein [Candidatus Sigynarchaeota archaeon]